MSYEIKCGEHDDLRFGLCFDCCTDLDAFDEASVEVVLSSGLRLVMPKELEHTKR